MRLAEVSRENRLLGSRRQLQRHEAWLDAWHRWLSERRRDLHRLHDARFPRQVHAVHGRTARRQSLIDNDRDVRPHDSPPPRSHKLKRQQRTKMETPRSRSYYRLLPRKLWKRALRSCYDYELRHKRNCTGDPAKAQGRQTQSRRNELGPDHADRGQSRHLHEDRFREPRSRRMLLHVVDLSRLLDLHARQGSARRALYHEPHLRDLW